MTICKSDHFQCNLNNMEIIATHPRKWLSTIFKLNGKRSIIGFLSDCRALGHRLPLKYLRNAQQKFVTFCDFIIQFLTLDIGF